MAGYSDEMFKYEECVICETYQIMKYSTSFMHKINNETKVCIISLYRSSRNPNDIEISSHLLRMMDPTRICIIAGDFNLNFKTDSNNLIIKVHIKHNLWI